MYVQEAGKVTKGTRGMRAYVRGNSKERLCKSKTKGEVM